MSTFSEVLFRSERREVLRRNPTLYGLDYVEAAPHAAGWVLRVHFVTKVGADARTVPPGLSPHNFVLTTSGGGAPLRVVAVQPGTADGEVRLRVVAAAKDRAGNTQAAYRLTLAHVPDVAPGFASATFLLTPHAQVDPRVVDTPPPVPLRAVEIDYLSKDYDSFRRLMLDHMAQAVPSWTERHAADLGVMLVEALAYTADNLSYYQDAVATETYLNTARRRISVRRHARMLDYVLHEGTNARAWVHFSVRGDAVPLPAATPLLTALPAYGLRIPPDRYFQGDVDLDGDAVRAFETLTAATLREAHNEMALYDWHTTAYRLEAGATTAALVGHVAGLTAGTVVLFEGRFDAYGAPAGQEQRAVVRLTADAERTADPLTDAPITRLVWAEEDALPTDFVVSVRTPDGAFRTGCSLARGNMVPADHGRSVWPMEQLPAVAAGVPYAPALRLPDVTFAVPYDAGADGTRPARAFTETAPQRAVPAVQLLEYGTPGVPPTLRAAQDADLRWTARPDLLSSSPQARDFVVEMTTERHATLRFGDGRQGRRPVPGAAFEVAYRVGNGPTGNIGPDTLAHVVTADARILGVRNPLPAGGGRSPEDLPSARLLAPDAYRSQRRCVTPSDYAAAAQRFPEVHSAAVRTRWTGSWHTVYVYVDRAQGRPVDEDYAEALRAFLEPLRVMGHEVVVTGARTVALALALRVQVDPRRAASTLRQTLQAVFSDQALPGGATGFFYPDRFDFGQPVYLSAVLAQALDVDGVAAVTPLVFRRWGAPDDVPACADVVPIGPLEVARLRNDPEQPQDGLLTFDMVGGR